MHAEILQNEPGSCPKCGMALEPSTVTVEEDEDPELRNMTRRCWVSVTLASPLFLISMADFIPGQPLARLIPPRVQPWIGLILVTPVVLWCGWPFLVRGWRSIITQNLNRSAVLTFGPPTTMN